MKKFFKELVYFTSVIILFVPFLIFGIFGFLAWMLFSLHDLLFDWVYE